MQFVLMPIDGLGYLAAGEPGALSAVAAFTEGALKTDLHNAVARYCVVAVGAKICHELTKAKIDRYIGRDEDSLPKSLRAAILVDQLINHIYSTILLPRTAFNNHATGTPWVLNIATLLRPVKGDSRIPWFDTLPSRIQSPEMLRLVFRERNEGICSEHRNRCFCR